MYLLLYLFNLIDYRSDRNVAIGLDLDRDLFVMDEVVWGVDLNEVGLVDESRDVDGG